MNDPKSNSTTGFLTGVLIMVALIFLQLPIYSVATSLQQVASALDGIALAIARK